jgi:hypothetical protein
MESPPDFYLHSADPEKTHFPIHIETIYDYTISEKEITIIFNGYCYVKLLKEVEEEYEEEKQYISYSKEEYIQYNLRNPPEKIQMFIVDNEKKEDHLYFVKMVDRTLLDNTSQYWSDEEVGGKICLFPTHKQKIVFEILEKIVAEK